MSCVTVSPLHLRTLPQDPSVSSENGVCTLAITSGCTECPLRTPLTHGKFNSKVNRSLGERDREERRRRSSTREGAASLDSFQEKPMFGRPGSSSSSLCRVLISRNESRSSTQGVKPFDQETAPSDATDEHSAVGDRDLTARPSQPRTDDPKEQQKRPLGLALRKRGRQVRP